MCTFSYHQVSRVLHYASLETHVGNEGSTLPGTSTSQLERCWVPEIPNLPSCFKVNLLVLGSKFHITLSSISLKDHEIKVKDLIFPYINM